MKRINKDEDLLFIPYQYVETVNSIVKHRDRLLKDNINLYNKVNELQHKNKRLWKKLRDRGIHCYCGV